MKKVIKDFLMRDMAIEFLILFGIPFIIGFFFLWFTKGFLIAMAIPILGISMAVLNIAIYYTMLLGDNIRGKYSKDNQ